MRWISILTLGILSASTFAQATAPMNVVPAQLPYTISKETTGVTAPLRADGSPDYVAALNERYGKGVKPDENGFVLWLQIVGTGDTVIAPSCKKDMLKLCGAAETDGATVVWENFEDYLIREKHLTGEALNKANYSINEAGNRLWEAKDRPEVAAFLRLQEKHLDMTVAAAEKKWWWIPHPTLEDHPAPLFIMLPALGPMREAANALCARATLRFSNGDIAGAARDIRAARLMARHLGNNATLIERMVAVNIERQAISAAGAIAGSGRLTEDQCKTLAEAMKNLAPLPAVSETIDVAQRWSMLSTEALIANHQEDVFRGYKEDEDDVGKFIKTIRVGFATIDRSDVDWDAVMQITNAAFDSYAQALRQKNMADMEKAMAAVLGDVEAWKAAAKEHLDPHLLHRLPNERPAAYSERVAHAFMAIILADVQTQEIRQRCEVMRGRMLDALIAVAAAKAHAGKWPARLDQVAGLDQLAIDIFTDKPAKYVVSNDGVLLYSVGANRKDDEGVMDQQTGKDDIAVGIITHER